jgi:hypothetical protein
MLNLLLKNPKAKILIINMKANPWIVGPQQVSLKKGIGSV